MSSSRDLTFRSAYCARERVPWDDFGPALFWRCLTPNRKVIIAALHLVRPGLFRLDRELIEEVADTGTMAEFEHEVRLHFGGIRERQWLRDKLKLRLSLHRLRKLAQGLLPKE